MHRQSLGSPSSSKHQYAAHGVVRDNGTVTLTEVAATATANSSLVDEEVKHKLQKLHKTAPYRPAEKYIHFIPVLTIICFLILYLSSHVPSQKDLAQFNGFKRLQKPIDSTNIDDLEQVLEIKKGDIMAIRSLRNLQEIDKEGSNHQRHRKFGDF